MQRKAQMSPPIHHHIKEWGHLEEEKKAFMLKSRSMPQETKTQNRGISEHLSQSSFICFVDRSGISSILFIYRRIQSEPSCELFQHRSSYHRDVKSHTGINCLCRAKITQSCGCSSSPQSWGSSQFWMFNTGVDFFWEHTSVIPKVEIVKNSVWPKALKEDKGGMIKVDYTLTKLWPRTPF